MDVVFSSSGITPAIELVAIKLKMIVVIWFFIIISKVRYPKNPSDGLGPDIGHRREVCEAADRKGHSLLDGFAYRQGQDGPLFCKYDVGDFNLCDRLCRFCGRQP